MIKKIVHIADLHIRTLQYHDIYQIQFDKFIHEVKLLRLDYSFDELRIVITGDIVHNKINISNEQFILTSNFIDSLSQLCPVIIIPGNHDFLENNVQRMDSITPIVEFLRNENIKYYKDMGVYEDDNVVWVVYSLYQHNERPEFERIHKDKKYIGLFHGPIKGFTTDLGFTFENGYDKTNFHGLQIVLCGDIHRQQSVNVESIIEIDENELKYYLDEGWMILT
jgi:predicted MPP superfamily phosphohydrolase